MNSYELSRAFCNWAFENPEKIKPIHYAIYFFTIEHCNRLGWKEKFGLPSQMVMEAIGVKNWRTYSEGLKDVVEFGFIKLIETSKNQYSSNIVAIVNFTKADTEATTKALDKALSKHSTKQRQSTVSIDKQITIEQLNKEQRTDLEIAFDCFLEMRKKIKKPATDRAIEMAKKKVMELSNGNEQLAIEIINQSTLNCWSDLYPLKQAQTQIAPSRRTTNEVFDKVQQQILNGELEIKPIL